ncbi:MAG: U32 family peptidase [Turicibacter sp.]|nr:U32 family peptidase [Turicibacter sp.]
MTKPELLTTPQSIDEIQVLAEAGAEAFVIGDARFALVVRGSFQEKNLEEAVTVIHELGKKVYLLIDAIFPNALLAELEIYLQAIKHMPFDGVRVADLGAYMLIKDLLPEMPIQFIDAMMLTNYETVNYWADKGIARARLAHELTLDEVLEIKKEAKTKIEVLIQGAPLMFTSRRKLVDNYLDFQKTLGRTMTVAAAGNYLYDAERHLYYPIIENDHGTHIYGGSDVCMIDDLTDLLDAEIDALYIESFTHETKELVKLVELYRAAIDLATTDGVKYQQVGRALYGEVEKLQTDKRPIDRGFYYKPTIYKNQSK